MHIHNEKEKHFIQLPFFSPPVRLSRAKGKFIYSISMLFLCAFMRSFHIFYDVRREKNLSLPLPQLMNVAVFPLNFQQRWRKEFEKRGKNSTEIDFQVVFVEFLIASQFKLERKFCHPLKLFSELFFSFAKREIIIVKSCFHSRAA
jgi:hypothetical protein